MNNFRLGLIDYPPWYYLKEDGSAGGLLAPYYQQLFYFILDKWNVTFVRVPGSEKMNCNDGVCNGWLANLQKGEIDFTIGRYVTLDEMENIGINLSLVSLMKEEPCFLANVQNVQVNFLKPGFFDFIYTFQTSFWFYLMLLSFFILALNGIVLKLQENYLYIDTFWPQFGYLLGQNFIVSSSIQRKGFFLVFLAGQLLVSKIMSASLRTGLVQRSEYVQLDSFADVIRHNFPVFTSQVNPCSMSWRKSEDKLARKLWNAATKKVLKNSSLLELAELLNYGYVFLSTLKACQAMKGYVCQERVSDTENNAFLRVSEKPIIHVKYGFLINKLNLQGRNEIIVNGLYSASEFGLISSKLLEDLFIKLQVPVTPPASCMAMKDLEAKVHVVPISMGYFTIPLLIFITGTGFSLLAFICVHLLEMCKRYYRVGKVGLVCTHCDQSKV